MRRPIRYCWPERFLPGKVPYQRVDLPNSYTQVRECHQHWNKAGHLGDVGELLLDKFGPGISVVDVGCGRGQLWPVLRGAVTSYVGVDNNPHFLEQARLDFPTIDFRLAAAQRLPAADGEFDVAVCCDVLMHVEDMVPVLAELVRVARCGVVLRVRTGNPSLKARMVYDPERDRLFKRLSGGYGFTYYNLLSRRTLRTLLQRVGVTEFHMSGYAPPDADVCAKSLVSFEVPACRKLSSL